MLQGWDAGQDVKPMKMTAISAVWLRENRRGLHWR